MRNKPSYFLAIFQTVERHWQSLSYSTPSKKLTISMVKYVLFNKQAKRKDVGSDQSYALITKNRERQQKSNRGREKGRSMNKGNSIGKSTYRRRSTYKCFHCDLEGHLKKNFHYDLECQLKLQREQKQNNNQRKKNGETLVTIIREVAFCFTHEKACLHVSSQDVEWVVDIATSYLSLCIEISSWRTKLETLVR